MGLKPTSQSDRLFIVAISVAVIAVMMGVLSNRLEREVVNAQELRYQFRLREIEAVVRLKDAALRTRGALAEAIQWDGANPMLWLATDELGMKTDLPDYLGELAIEQVLEQKLDAHGKWTFDSGRKMLAYLPVTVEEPVRLEDWLQFRLSALRSKEGAVVGLALQPVAQTKH